MVLSQEKRDKREGENPHKSQELEIDREEHLRISAK
jgi:nucleoid DNA-binding protein